MPIRKVKVKNKRKQRIKKRIKMLSNSRRVSQKKTQHSLKKKLSQNKLDRLDFSSKLNFIIL